MQSAPATSSRRIAASGLALRLRSGASRQGIHAARTVMRFSVSVPVLSVQTTETAESVSMAGSRRTSTRRRAMRWTPSASARVTVGRSPSGTLATMMPMPKRKDSAKGSPSSVHGEDEDREPHPDRHRR